MKISIRKTIQTIIRAGEILFRAIVVFTVAGMYYLMNLLTETEPQTRTTIILGILGLMYFIKPIIEYITEIETEKLKDEIMAEIEKQEQLKELNKKQKK